MDNVLNSEMYGQTLWLTMNRPKALNALSFELLDALYAALLDAENDDNVRSVVVTGTGKAFSAGADLKAQIAKYSPGEKDILDRCVEIFDVLRNFKKPTIAAINGLTCGGGLELAMCCDLLYANDVASIGDAHCNYGIVPGGGGAAIMPRLLPLPIVKYLLFTGEFLPAGVLRQYGMINDVFQQDELKDNINKITEIINSKSPIGLSRSKRVANEALDKSAADALYDERLASRDQFRSYDYNEGITAFLEKRTPQFKGF